MSEPLKSKTSWISTAIVLSAPSRAAGVVRGRALVGAAAHRDDQLGGRRVLAAAFTFSAARRRCFSSRARLSASAHAAPRGEHRDA